jgi:hypothetical protein
MALEQEDPIRRLLADLPRPRLSEDFSHALMRRVRQEQDKDAHSHGVGARLVLGAYWLAALVASAAILHEGPLPAWATTSLWIAALVAVPAGYAIVLWSTMGALASRQRG